MPGKNDDPHSLEDIEEAIKNRSEEEEEGSPKKTANDFSDPKDILDEEEPVVTEDDLKDEEEEDEEFDDEDSQNDKNERDAKIDDPRKSVVLGGRDEEEDEGEEEDIEKEDSDELEEDEDPSKKEDDLEDEEEKPVLPKKTFLPSEEEEEPDVSHQKSGQDYNDANHSLDPELSNHPSHSEHTLDDLASEDEEVVLPGDEPSRQESFHSNIQSASREDFIDDEAPSRPTSDSSKQFSSLGGSFHHKPGSNQFYSNRQMKFHGMEKSGSSTKWHLFILVVLGLIVIGVTVYLLRGNIASFTASEPSPTPTPLTVEPTPSPTPSPTPVVDRSKYKVRILNGSGKTGLAASISAKLKELGYQTERVGNATNSAFKTTNIRSKSGAVEVVEQLIKDLLPDFTATSSGTLRDSDAADLEVILGAS